MKGRGTRTAAILLLLLFFLLFAAVAVDADKSKRKSSSSTSNSNNSKTKLASPLVVLPEFRNSDDDDKKKSSSSSSNNNNNNNSGNNGNADLLQMSLAVLNFELIHLQMQFQALNASMERHFQALRADFHSELALLRSQCRFAGGGGGGGMVDFDLVREEEQDPEEEEKKKQENVEEKDEGETEEIKISAEEAPAGEAATADTTDDGTDATAAVLETLLASAPLKVLVYDRYGLGLSSGLEEFFRRHLREMDLPPDTALATIGGDWASYAHLLDAKSVVVYLLPLSVERLITVHDVQAIHRLSDAVAADVVVILMQRADANDDDSVPFALRDVFSQDDINAPWPSYTQLYMRYSGSQVNDPGADEYNASNLRQLRLFFHAKLVRLYHGSHVH